jgi:hypothetical protein
MGDKTDDEKPEMTTGKRGHWNQKERQILNLILSTLILLPRYHFCASNTSGCLTLPGVNLLQFFSYPSSTSGYGPSGVMESGLIS